MDKKTDKGIDKPENTKKGIDPKTNKQDNEKLPGYPIYPPSEDVYSRMKEERDIDPENPAQMKVADKPDKSGKRNEKDFNEDLTGSDLDIPGAEMDDAQEDIGSEDEENNYYSLGGDDKENLEESKDELR